MRPLEREVERAVVRRGKYRLREEYQNMEVLESDWFKMTRDQRMQHLKKIKKCVCGKFT